MSIQRTRIHATIYDYGVLVFKPSSLNIALRKKHLFSFTTLAAGFDSLFKHVVRVCDPANRTAENLDN